MTTTTFSDYGITVRPGSRGEIKTLCPKCSADRQHPRDPCLSVSIEKGVWNCHNCGWAGGLRDRPERKWTAIEVQTKPATDAVYDWLFGERHISRAVLERNRVEMSNRAIDGASHACVAFVYYADGVAVNAKFRTRDKRFTQTPGGASVPYKMDDLDGAERCIITEGEIDALSFEEAGYMNAVSVPCGAINAHDKSADGKLRFLETCPGLFDAMEAIYLAMDADDHGTRTRDELARRLGPERCWVVAYPEGCKDANDVLVRHGSVALAECIKTARPYPVDGILSVDDLTEGFWALRSGALGGGAKIGLGTLDNYMTWATPALTIVTGAPNSGKSPFFDMIATLLMVKHDWRIGFFTPENFPTEVHVARMVEQLVGAPVGRAYNGHMSDEDARVALNFLRERIHYILPTDDAYTVDMVLEKSDFLVSRYGVKMLIIDPWNFFEHQYQGDSETVYTSKCLNRMRTFARRRGVHLVVVAHPRKLMKNKDGTQPPATMYDISGSANFYNMADFGISVERKRDGDTEHGTVIHIMKVKHSHMGKLGEVYLQYEVATKRYRGVAEVDNRIPLIELPHRPPVRATYRDVEEWRPPLDDDPF